MPSSHLILWRPLLLLPSIPPSISVFSNESALHVSWPKYWSFSFSIIPSKEIPGLTSFRMDWLDLPAVQGTFKSLLQSLVQFSHSVMSDSLRPHESQHARLPVHYQLLQLAQTRVHRVSDAIQQSCLLSSASPLDFNLSQHQGLF